jgi:hypothetical protein
MLACNMIIAHQPASASQTPLRYFFDRRPPRLGPTVYPEPTRMVHQNRSIFGDNGSHTKARNPIIFMRLLRTSL